MFLICLSIIIFSSCNYNSPSESQNLQTRTKPSVLKKYYLKRPNYKLEYYSNWKIDSADIDFDIDTYFTLNSSDESSIIFFIFNTEVDAKEYVDKQVKAHLEKIVKGGKVTYFTDWGRYKGYGANINGKFLGIYNGEIKFFCNSTDSNSFLMISQLFESDRAKDESCLKLIETSFKINQ